MSLGDAESRIVAHMNDDHADALANYVAAFTDHAMPELVRMTDIDAAGMTLRINDTTEVHIPFDPPLHNADEARMRLVEMAQEARDQLAK